MTHKDRTILDILAVAIWQTVEATISVDASRKQRHLVIVA